MRRTTLTVLLLAVIVAVPAVAPPPAGASDLVRTVSQVDAGVASSDPVVALTFDDGPDGWAIPQVLAILARYGVPGTFFVPGVNAAANPALVRRISDAGHVVAGHGWSHKAFTSLSAGALDAEVRRTDALLRDITGRSAPCQRPPGGSVSSSVVRALDAAGDRTVMWSVDPWDWKGPGAAAITARVLGAVRPGAIVLLHPGSGVRAGTVAALPSIIEGLRARGYRFVSICGGPRTGPSVATPLPFGADAPWLAPVTGNAPFAGAVSTPSRLGTWLAGTDGGVFALGDAPFLGSLGALPLNQPIVGMATTATGRGYWLAAADGGVFAFGDAAFLGSGAASGLRIVGIARAPAGYRLAASDSTTLGFGTAGAGPVAGLQAPITGIAAAPTPDGWWLVGADGGVFSFGDAPFAGSEPSADGARSTFGLVAAGSGYVLLTQRPAR